MCGWMGRRDQDERYTKRAHQGERDHKFILQLYFDGSLASLAGWLPPLAPWLACLLPGLHLYVMSPKKRF